MSIKIVVVEDHPIVREGIVAYLNVCDGMEVVGEVETLENLFDSMNDLKRQQVNVDIVLLDLQLGEHNSLSHIGGLIEMGCKVLILSSAHRYETLIQAVDAGAFCFISKSILPDKLATVIQDAHRGKRYITPEIESEEDVRIALTELTEKELTVLKFLAVGLSNQDIAEQLSVSVKTVRFHTSNILSKLNLNDRTQAAVLAWRQGLVR